MSNSQLATKVSTRSKLAAWYNNLFKTRLEKDAEKLIAMLSNDNDNQPKGKFGFRHQRSGMEKDVAFADEMQLKDLSVSYWCEMTGSTWKEFSEDAEFLSGLHNALNENSDKLIQDMGRLCSRNLKELEKVADDKKKQLEIKKQFDDDAKLLMTACEVSSVEIINKAFLEKAKTFGDYKKYKFKAGAKLFSTFAGLVVSIAALSTAATPAAPATLVPALIGLVSASLSVGKQIADLLASAEEIEAEIKKNLQSIEFKYKDDKGKAKKKTYRAREFGTGFMSGLTGGASDVICPSIKGLLDETGMHKSKVDGLEVRLHTMGIAINSTVDGMTLADKVFEDNKTKLNKVLEGGTKREVVKLLADLEKSRLAYEKVKAEFYEAFTTGIPAMSQRIAQGRIANAKFKETLEKIEKELGTGGFALVGSLFATICLTGIGFSSPPTEQIEKIMSGVGVGMVVIDQAREYTPDVMEKAFGE